MEFYAYAFIELIILLALPLYIFGVIVCALAGAEHETGWLTALFLAIFFTPIVGLICVFSSPLKSEVWRQKDRKSVV